MLESAVGSHCFILPSFSIFDLVSIFVSLVCRVEWSAIFPDPFIKNLF